MLPDLTALREILRTAAREELLPRFAEVAGRCKRDGSLVTEADVAMQRRLQRELHARWPNYCFLGEEMSDDVQDALVWSASARNSAAMTAEARRARDVKDGEAGATLGADTDGSAGAAEEYCALTCGHGRRSEGLWVLDPLDGTSNFAAGIPMFAVSLALIVDERPVLGVILDPVRDECFMARQGVGAWLNDAPLESRTIGQPALPRTIGVVDCKRLDRALATRLSLHPPFGSQRNFGSCCLEWCWLADGRFHLYLHGGQKLWDFAAGSLILAEAGGWSETLTKEPVFDLTLSTRSVVAASERGLFEGWRDWLEQTQRSLSRATQQ